MECSQRCAKDIYALANRLVTETQNFSDVAGAFYQTLMKPVEGKNPVSVNAVETENFDDFNDERAYIISKIREIYKKDKNADVAILLRSNFQIEEYSRFLANSGFDVVTRSDSLDRQPAFRLILGLLKFVHSPWDNSNVLNIVDILGIVTTPIIFFQPFTLIAQKINAEFTIEPTIICEFVAIMLCTPNIAFINCAKKVGTKKAINPITIV